MKILNFNKLKRFSVGRTVIATHDYLAGKTKIPAGSEGIIEKVKVESFPDLGLFDLSLIRVKR